MSGNDSGTAERDPRHLDRLEPVVLVGIGGFAGANLRYLAALVVPGLGGTLLANVAGSFALGVVLYESLLADEFAPETRAVVSTGFLSSLTTYSTFALQSAGSPPVVLVANVLANYGLGFGAVLLGRAVAGRLVGSGDGSADGGGRR